MSSTGTQARTSALFTAGATIRLWAWETQTFGAAASSTPVYFWNNCGRTIDELNFFVKEHTEYNKNKWEVFLDLLEDDCRLAGESIREDFMYQEPNGELLGWGEPQGHTYVVECQNIPDSILQHCLPNDHELLTDACVRSVCEHTASPTAAPAVALRDDKKIPLPPDHECAGDNHSYACDKRYRSCCVPETMYDTSHGSAESLPECYLAGHYCCETSEIQTNGCPSQSESSNDYPVPSPVAGEDAHGIHDGSNQSSSSVSSSDEASGDAPIFVRRRLRGTGN